MYVRNKINVSGLEINISEKCNLSCKGCDHSMDIIESRIIPIAQLVSDLENASKYFHTNTLRIIGGEPLLHPDLSNIIYEFSHIGIANSIELWTNGILLKTVGKENWQLLNGIVISKYPKIIIKLPKYFLKNLSDEFNIWINIRECKTFSWSMGYKKHQYNTAKLLHDSCRESSTCHTIRNGKFYKCVQSAFAKDRLSSMNCIIKEDGVGLYGSFKDFYLRVHNHMWSIDPINACYYCFGEYGEQFPHRLLNRTYNEINAEFKKGLIIPNNSSNLLR